MIKNRKIDFYSVASSRPFTHGQVSWLLQEPCVVNFVVILKHTYQGNKFDRYPQTGKGKYTFPSCTSLADYSSHIHCLILEEKRPGNDNDKTLSPITISINFQVTIDFPVLRLVKIRYI